MAFWKRMMGANQNDIQDNLNYVRTVYNVKKKEEFRELLDQANKKQTVSTVECVGYNADNTKSEKMGDKPV